MFCKLVSVIIIALLPIYNLIYLIIYFLCNQCIFMSHVLEHFGIIPESEKPSVVVVELSILRGVAGYSYPRANT